MGTADILDFFPQTMKKLKPAIDLFMDLNCYTTNKNKNPTAHVSSWPFSIRKRVAQIYGSTYKE